MGFKFRVDLYSRVFNFAIFCNREKRDIKYPLGSIIVHLTRGQDVELISRRTKLRFGWTLSSTAESNVELLSSEFLF